MKKTRSDSIIAQVLYELIAKSTPYELSSPTFGNPTIHDFVKGLILSTNIIEEIEKQLPNGYKADWGQVIDLSKGDALSRECDIIIYHGKPYKTINNQSMRFVIVEKTKSKIVIQVKSSVSSVSSDDRTYSKDLKKFVSQVWYVAECCLAKNITRANKIKQDLKHAGYNQFCYFYRMDDNSMNRKIDEEQFIKFIKTIRKIK